MTMNDVCVYANQRHCNDTSQTIAFNVLEKLRVGDQQTTKPQLPVGSNHPHPLSSMTTTNPSTPPRAPFYIQVLLCSCSLKGKARQGNGNWITSPIRLPRYGYARTAQTHPHAPFITLLLREAENGRAGVLCCPSTWLQNVISACLYYYHLKVDPFNTLPWLAAEEQTMILLNCGGGGR